MESCSAKKTRRKKDHEQSHREAVLQVQGYRLATRGQSGRLAPCNDKKEGHRKGRKSNDDALPRMPEAAMSGRVQGDGDMSDVVRIRNSEAMINIQFLDEGFLVTYFKTNQEINSKAYACEDAARMVAVVGQCVDLAKEEAR